MSFAATMRRTRVAPYGFTYRSPDGGAEWEFEGEYVPGESDTNTFPHWEHDKVIDEYGDERDPEQLCPLWWEEVTNYADQLVREDFCGDGL